MASFMRDPFYRQPTIVKAGKISRTAQAISFARSVDGAETDGLSKKLSKRGGNLFTWLTGFRLRQENFITKELCSPVGGDGASSARRRRRI